MAILAALDAGQPVREIASRFRVSTKTLAQLAKTRESLDLDVIIPIMQAKAADALDAWALSMQTGALAGKHAPARDWLTHAKVLTPINAETRSGAKVMILIGAPGRDLSASALQVIDTEAVTATE